MGQWGVEGVDFLPPIGCLTCMPFHALTPFAGKKKKKWFRKTVPTKCQPSAGLKITVPVGIVLKKTQCCLA